MKKSFLAFVRKETLHLLRDPRTLLIALFVPVIQMLLFGFAISTEINNINVMICDPCDHKDTSELAARLDANPVYTFAGYVGPSDIDAALVDGKAEAIVVFDSGHRAQILIDGSNPVTAQSTAQYLTATMSETTPDASVRILYNPQLRSAYNFVPGIMGLIFIIICAMLTSVSIVRERETGTLEVLLVSPIRPGMIYIGKLIPYFILACIDLAAILFIARHALQVPLTGSIPAIIILSLTYIILSLGFGLLISTLVDSQMVALLISGMVLMVPVIMLSGMLFPIENMQQPLQWLSAIVPARWYIAAMRKLMIQGLCWDAVASEATIISVMTIIILTLAIKRFKIRLQ